MPPVIGTVLGWCAGVVGAVGIIVWLLTVVEWLVDRAVRSFRVYSTVIDYAIHRREFKAWLSERKPK